MPEKTIFLTVSRGMIARNFLLHDLYRILREQYHVVILTPAAHDPDFLKAFSHPNVEFVELKEYPWGPGERISTTVLKYLMLSDSVILFSLYGIPNIVPRSRFYWLKYAVCMVLCKPLSKIHGLKAIVRFLDDHLTQRTFVRELRQLIRQKNPAFILSLNVTSDRETALAKAARREQVPVWSMPKSWDNLDNTCFRIKTEKLLLWNEFMKEQALNLQGYTGTEVEVVGIPQFDIYRDPSRLQTREAFCASVGLDPTKKIILFASEGKGVPGDPVIAQILIDFLRTHRYAVPAQLFIRPHFAYKGEVNRFTRFVGIPGVFVDTFFKASPSFKDSWDYSETFTNRLINTLYHADVVINTISTISLDVGIFDKPIVSIGFDQIPPLPYEKSVLRWYGTDHSKELMRTGGLRMVHDDKELLAAVNMYLTDPTVDAAGRERLRARLCGPLNEGIGKRLAERIIERVG